LNLRGARFGRNERLFLLSTLVDGIAFSGTQLFFNFYILSLGHDREFLGLVNTIPFLAGLLLGLPLGALSDRMGYRRSMLLGLALCFSMFAVVVTTPSVPVLMAAMAISGTGQTLYYLSTVPFMTGISTPAERTYLFSVNAGLQTLASAVGNFLAGFLPGWFAALLRVPMDGPVAYRAVMLFSLALGSLSLVPLLLVGRTAAPGLAPKAAETREAFAALRTGVVRRLVFPNLMIGIGAAILLPYMNVFFKEKFRIADTALGILFSLSAVLTAFGAVASPRLAEWLGTKIRAVTLTQGLSLVFLLLLGFWPGFYVAGVAYLLRAALMNMAAPLYSAFAMEQAPPEQRGLVSSALYLTYEVGWAFGPYLSGFVQERWGFSPLFVSTTVVYALAVAVTWTFFSRVEKAGTPR
jgi:MFS family permease